MGHIKTQKVDFFPGLRVLFNYNSEKDCASQLAEVSKLIL